MADRPILFSAPMVRSLLAGRKSQTRRLIPSATVDAYYEYDDWCRSVSAGVPTSRQWEPEYFLERTRIKAGDRLWVREAWRLPNSFDEDSPVRAATRVHPSFKPNVFFEADGAVRSAGAATGKPGRLRASMHMPRWASRLTLTVTDVRVHRINDIKGRDIIAEGVRCDGCYDTGHSACRDGGCFAQRIAFENLWDGINGLGCMASNPFVAAYTFTVEHRNIDAEVRHDL